MADSNPFEGFPLVRLQRLQEAYIQGIEDIATTGGSYNINGRSFTAADLDKMKETLRELNEAIDLVNGVVRGVECAQVNLVGRYGSGYGDVNRYYNQ